MKISVNLTPGQLTAINKGKPFNFNLSDGAHEVEIDDKKLVKLLKLKSSGKGLRIKPNEIIYKGIKGLKPITNKTKDIIDEATPVVAKPIYQIKETVGGKLNITKTFKKLGRQIKKGFNDFGDDLQTAERAVRKNPISRAIVKTVIPEAVKLATQAGATALTGSPEIGSLASLATKSATQAGLKQAGYGLIQDYNKIKSIYNANDTGTTEKEYLKQQIKDSKQKTNIIGGEVKRLKMQNINVHEHGQELEPQEMIQNEMPMTHKKSKTKAKGKKTKAKGKKTKGGSCKRKGGSFSKIGGSFTTLN